MSGVPEQCPVCGESSETIAPTEGCTRCLACGWVTVPITIEPARITQYILMDLLRSGLNDFSAWVRALCARWLPLEPYPRSADRHEQWTSQVERIRGHKHR